MKKSVALVFLVTAAALEALPVSAQTTEAKIKVGVASATTLVATGKPPRRAERILEVGTDLVENERITTSETGRVYLLFRDGSTLSVGPNADLVLDSYLYDSRAKTGKIAFSAAKGVFRFIGGRISKSDRVEFKTPVATLGIRGGIIQFSVPPSGDKVMTTHIFGEETTITTNVRAGAQFATIARQEFRAVIDAAGGIVFSRLKAAQFDEINRMFETPAGAVASGLPAAGRGMVQVPALSQGLPPVVPVLSGDALIQNTRSIEPFDTSIIQRVLRTVGYGPGATVCNDVELCR